MGDSVDSARCSLQSPSLRQSHEDRIENAGTASLLRGQQAVVLFGYRDQFIQPRARHNVSLKGLMSDFADGVCKIGKLGGTGSAHPETVVNGYRVGRFESGSFTDLSSQSVAESVCVVGEDCRLVAGTGDSDISES
jgi:hypothetical protein